MSQVWHNKSMLEDKTYNYLIQYSYIGTKYSGLQRQTTNSQTVQEVLEKAFNEAFDYSSPKVIVTNRTDTGVHAKTQYLKLITSTNRCAEKIIRRCNQILPLDIRLNSCEFVANYFNLNNIIKSKTYRYFLTDSSNLNAFMAQTVYLHPKKLDFDLMAQGAKLFNGEIDIRHFCVLGGRNPSTTKRNIQAYLRPYHMDRNDELERIFFLEISSTGFLKYTIRFIMGALILVGSHEIGLDELKESLHSNALLSKSFKAPANGLQLYDIKIKV